MKKYGMILMLAGLAFAATAMAGERDGEIQCKFFFDAGKGQFGLCTAEVDLSRVTAKNNSSGTNTNQISITNVERGYTVKCGGETIYRDGFNIATSTIFGGDVDIQDGGLTVVTGRDGRQVSSPDFPILKFDAFAFPQSGQNGRGFRDADARLYLQENNGFLRGTCSLVTERNQDNW